ncbi:type VI secretion system protein ImpA [Luteibacter rhizovicinus]|uniref:Type VI secretion system protein ImpA n=1 Tax=Luteibacter rhizovicinus TaxID=242606 RepID=A0A4R3YVI5_9GAMM|nr:type VI secretion system protein TssA [Luteibacter rhizovicinus]TCV95828.1 type VI secretion system protein ImpA [Luteibacter rhizovicinus]
MMTEQLLSELLVPLADEAPTGDNLEYDPDFLALERAAEAKTERVTGDSVIAAEEPDWEKVEQRSLGLLERSRDLRVSVHLCAAWTRMHGLRGWADGLALIRGLLETFWDSVHPQLDAEDNDDPTSRVNAVVSLGDPLGLLGYFRVTPFVQSPRLGRFSLRDLRIANGTLKILPGDGTSAAPSLSEIEACCLDCSEEQFKVSVEAIRQALEHARAIDHILNEHLGTAAPDLRVLLDDLRELAKFVEPHWAARTSSGEATDDDAEVDGGAASTGQGAAANSSSGRIAGPQDVMRRIDDICAYYAANEPSSPVPLLLRRAQRLVGRNFMDLLKDLAPAGIDELQHISGVQAEEG